MLLNTTDGNNPSKHQHKCGLWDYKKNDSKKKQFYYYTINHNSYLVFLYFFLIFTHMY